MRERQQGVAWQEAGCSFLELGLMQLQGRVL